MSKTFTAIAVLKALHDDPDVWRNSKMRSILNLTGLAAGATIADDFSKVTVCHLLESCSGINQNDMRGSMANGRENTTDDEPVSVQTLA